MPVKRAQQQRKKAKAMRVPARSLLPLISCFLSVALLADVLPVPRLVKVRAKAELRSISHQPAISFGLGLQGAVFVFGADRFATDVDVQRPPGEMRAVDGKPGPPAVG